MSRRAYYMNFRARDARDENFIGGVPSIYPPDYPWPEEDDGVVGFLAQFRVDGELLRVPGAEWIHLYQGTEEGDDPTPMAVVLATGEGSTAPPRRRLSVHRSVREQGIAFDERADPDIFPGGAPSEDNRKLFLSKLGGVDPCGLDSGEHTFLGQIHEAAPKISFGGRVCGLYLRGDGQVLAVLW